MRMTYVFAFSFGFAASTFAADKTVYCSSTKAAGEALMANVKAEALEQTLDKQQLEEFWDKNVKPIEEIQALLSKYCDKK